MDETLKADAQTSPSDNGWVPRGRAPHPGTWRTIPHAIKSRSSLIVVWPWSVLTSAARQKPGAGQKRFLATSRLAALGACSKYPATMVGADFAGSVRALHSREHGPDLRPLTAHPAAGRQDPRGRPPTPLQSLGSALPVDSRGEEPPAGGGQLALVPAGAAYGVELTPENGPQSLAGGAASRWMGHPSMRRARWGFGWAGRLRRPCARRGRRQQS